MANRGRPRKNIESDETNISNIMTNNDSRIINANLNTNSTESQPSSKKDKEIFAVFASVNDTQSQYFNLTNPNGNKTFADLLIPTEYNEQIKKAKELRESDLVDRLLRIRQDYFARVKGFKCKNKIQQKFYNDNVLPLVKKFARQWEYEFWSISEVFCHYGFKKDNKTLMFVRSENGEYIKPIEAFGFEAFEVKISPKLKQQIKKLKDKNLIDKLPDYLLKAIDDKGSIKDTITLDNENLYRSCNQKPDYEQRPKPNLLRIMKSISLREFLIDLDFINAYASQKTSIIHSKGGTKEQPWAQGRVQELHKLITERAPGMCFLTTPGDCEISSVDINLNELFDPKKFEEVTKRILDFFGIGVVFVPSQAAGINNQSVIVSLKPFEESIKTDRKIFQEFINVLCEQINEKNGFTKIPSLEFEHINIRSDNEFIKELQFLRESGVLSWEDICVEFDFDRDEQLEKKKFDWDNRDIESQTFENSQGLSPLLEKTVEQKIKIAHETKQNNNQNIDSDLFNNN